LYLLIQKKRTTRILKQSVQAEDWGLPKVGVFLQKGRPPLVTPCGKKGARVRQPKGKAKNKRSVFRRVQREGGAIQSKGPLREIQNTERDARKKQERGVEKKRQFPDGGARGRSLKQVLSLPVGGRAFGVKIRTPFQSRKGKKKKGERPVKRDLKKVRGLRNTSQATRKGPENAKPPAKKC